VRGARMYSHGGVRTLAQLMRNTKTQKKQTDILKVASKLFLEHGYDAVSLDDILERVGGSKTTLYSYYGGKEGLFAATIQNMCRDKLDALRALDSKQLDPSAALNAIGKHFLSILSDPQSRALFRAMISEAERFPKIASTFFAAGPETMIGIVRDKIQQWQKQALLRSGDPEVLAIQFLGLMMGNFHLKSLLGLMEPLTERQIKAWVARGVDVFLDGTLPRKA
jgi:TetR/AcrR family transcriptional regulator, mexJK operon transcriptional repressor